MSAHFLIFSFMFSFCLLKNDCLNISCPSLRHIKTGTRLILGTNLAKELRSRGYQGLILIRSADAAEDDEKIYKTGGAVDGCIGKNASGVATADLIRAEYIKKKSTKQTTRS